MEAQHLWDEEERLMLLSPDSLIPLEQIAESSNTEEATDS